MMVGLLWGGQLTEFYRDVGSRIRTARESKSLSQDAVARKVGLSRTSLTNIEKGRQRLLLHTFVGIARELEISAADLLPAMGGSSLVVSVKLPSNLEQKERDFVQRSLGGPINHNASTPKVRHLPKGTGTSRTKQHCNRSRKR